MSLQSRLNDLISAVGADVKAIKGNYVPKANPALNKARAIMSVSRRQSVPIMFLGHSYVAGLNSTKVENSWVGQLAAKLQAAYPSGIYGWENPIKPFNINTVTTTQGLQIYNGGISGSYSNNYVTAAVQTKLTAVQPQIVFHMIGINDFNLGVLKADFKSFLTQSMDLVNASLTVPPVHILVDQFHPPSKQNPVSPWSHFQEVMDELSRENPTSIVYIPVAEAFTEAQATGFGALDPYDLIDTDNLHPTNEGHALIAQKVATELQLPPPPMLSIPEGYDRFNRKTVAKDLETAQGWLVPAGGAWASAAYGGIYSAGNASVLSTDLGMPEAEISAVFTFAASGLTGFLIRSTDQASGLKVYLHNSSNQVAVFNGATRLTWSGAGPLVVGNKYHLSVQLLNNVMTIHLNGKRVLNYTVSTTVMNALSSTNYGLFATASANVNSLIEHVTIRRASA